MPRYDGVIAAMVGIAFGMLATLWMVVLTFVAGARGQSWPWMRRYIGGGFALGATSIGLMSALRLFHADPQTLDHLAKVLAVLVPIVAIASTIRSRAGQRR